MCIKVAALAFCLFIPQLVTAQGVVGTITNADILNMAKAGIGDKTIVIAIERGPARFDISPQALIALKAGGVSDEVLNKILASAPSAPSANAILPSFDATALFHRALEAVGTQEEFESIRAFRSEAKVTQNGPQGAKSFEREVILEYPDRSRMTFRGDKGSSTIQVVTPEFNYIAYGSRTAIVPQKDLDSIREAMLLDLITIGKHPEAYAVEVAANQPEGHPNIRRLKISHTGLDIFWDVDTESGRIVSTRKFKESKESVVTLSDWRPVDGLYHAFKSLATDSGVTTDTTVVNFQFNPPTDPTLFQKPAQDPKQGLTLKVLQEQSTPYTQTSGGGVSTNCSITGTANTSGTANTFGNTTFGNATTNSNQRMNCNSYDTTMRWPHVLNVMFAEASDGNSYMFACDRAWRWSKCVPLRVGDVFNAHFTNKGLEIETIDTKGKEQNPTYNVLQSMASK